MLKHTVIVVGTLVGTSYLVAFKDFQGFQFEYLHQLFTILTFMSFCNQPTMSQNAMR